jgi:hypothetical protein
MPENNKEEKSPKRVDRFIYSEEDVNHIFKLGKTGDVFNSEEQNENILLKKLIPTSKKSNK